MISTVLDPSLRKWEGKNLVEIGKEMGKDPRDAAMIWSSRTAAKPR
jgi:hypothetical protein